MIRKVFWHIVFFLSLIFLAQIKTSAQVNIIHFYDDIDNAVNYELGSFIVVCGNPENISQIKEVCSQAEICLIRGHQSWTNFGEQMANEPETAAQAWKDALSQLNLPGKRIYFEPWNEPDRDYECGGKTGQNCADAVNRFINTLLQGSQAPHIVDNIILTTPAIDLHIDPDRELERFGVYSSIISSNPDRFGAVSVHAYSVEAAQKYSDFLNRLGLSGKQVFFSEIGVLKENSLAPERLPEDEPISYLPQDLCNEFCHRAGGLINFLQNSSGVEGWALFSRSPGNYTGPAFNLWEHQCVIDALKGNCHCQDCQEISSDDEEGETSASRQCKIAPPSYRVCEGWEPQKPLCDNLPFTSCIRQEAQNKDLQTPNRHSFFQSISFKVSFENQNVSSDDSPPTEQEVVISEIEGSAKNLIQVISQSVVNLAQLFLARTSIDFHQFSNSIPAAILTKMPPIAYRLPFNYAKCQRDRSIRSVLKKKKGGKNDLWVASACLDLKANKVYATCQKIDKNGQDPCRPMFISEFGCFRPTLSECDNQNIFSIKEVPLTQSMENFCRQIYGSGFKDQEKITADGAYWQKFAELLNQYPALAQLPEHWSGVRSYFTCLAPDGETREGITIVNSNTGDRENGQALLYNLKLASPWLWFLPKKQDAEEAEENVPFCEKTETSSQGVNGKGPSSKPFLIEFFHNLTFRFWSNQQKITRKLSSPVKVSLPLKQVRSLQTAAKFYRWFLPSNINNKKLEIIGVKKGDEDNEIPGPDLRDGSLFIQYFTPKGIPGWDSQKL